MPAFLLRRAAAVLVVVARVVARPSPSYYNDGRITTQQQPWQPPYQVSYDPRPFYLINNMTDSPLKHTLQSCANGPGSITSFSIGHRGGGTLQFPELTVESTMAGARMGSGILECDVAFTADRELVCRHSFCDLHTTTDILLRPEMAAKCTIPFTPANATSPADALCCTSDISMDEFTSLCGKQDGFNASAITVEDYQRGTPNWRTDLYGTCGKVMTLDSFITLVESIPGNRNFTPELKTPPAQVPMPFHGYTQEQFARDMLDTFIERGIRPERTWAQSFNPPDVYQWIAEYPEFGRQAVLLDESGDSPATYPAAVARLQSLKDRGVNIIAPPFGYLLTTANDSQTIVPSSYATTAKAAGLDIIPWTYERSGPLATVGSREEYYFSRIKDAVHYDGQYYEILDFLARDVGIAALFTDWSSTVSYYANCMGLGYGGFQHEE